MSNFNFFTIIKRMCASRFFVKWTKVSDSDNEEECDEKSLFFEDEVKSKLPVASLILLKLRVLRLLFVLTDMFCDHAPFIFKRNVLYKNIQKIIDLRTGLSHVP